MLEFLTGNSIGIGLGISMVVNLVLGFMQIRSGGNEIRKQIADDYKERNMQLELRLKEMENILHDTQKQMSELKGIMTGKDKHIESLTALVQGRNPEMIEVLKEIKEGNIAIQQFIKTTYELLNNASQELGYQTKILEKREKRENEAGRVV